MVVTPEAMINRLLFISDRKVLRVLNMRRWPTDHAAGSGVFRYHLRSGCWPRMIYSIFKVREGSCVVLPPPISKKLLLFEPPKQKKFEKLFSLLTTFGKKPPVLNERKLKIQRKKPRKSSACGKSAIRRLIFRAYLHFGSVDPRGPNFAEIHARGRRGRLESEPRDLIPPWGHGLFHGETEKPTMAVWHDQREGMFHHGGQGW